MAGHITQGQADEYAIGALEPEMERLITLHAADCVQCRDLLFESEDVVASLALTTPLRKAPPRLKHKVAVRSGIVRPGPLHYVLRFGQAAAVFASVVFAVAALTGMVSMRGQVQELRDQNVELDREIRNVASQEVEIFALGMRLSEAERRASEFEASAEEDRDLIAAIMNPDAETADVVSSEHANGSLGRLIWEEDQKRLWFVARNLPPLPEGMRYQLWVESGGDYLSLGSLPVDESGTATFVRNLPNGLSSYASVVVTVEHSGEPYERKGNAIFFVTNLSSMGD